MIFDMLIYMGAEKSDWKETVLLSCDMLQFAYLTLQMWGG